MATRLNKSHFLFSYCLCSLSGSNRWINMLMCSTWLETQLANEIFFFIIPLKGGIIYFVHIGLYWSGWSDFRQILAFVLIELYWGRLFELRHISRDIMAFSQFTRLAMLFLMFVHILVKLISVILMLWCRNIVYYLGQNHAETVLHCIKLWLIDLCLTVYKTFSALHAVNSDFVE